MKFYLLGILFFSLLSCSETPDMTMDYLKSHPEEVEKQIKRCEKLSIKKSVNDSVCQAASRIKKGNVLMKNYPKRGERIAPPPTRNTLPLIPGSKS